MSKVQSGYYQKWKGSTIVAAINTDTILTNEQEYIIVDTTPNTVQITLPDTSNPDVGNGKQIFVNDSGGNAFTNNITVIPNPSDSSTIENKSSFVINQDNMQVGFELNEDQWNRITDSYNLQEDTFIREKITDKHVFVRTLADLPAESGGVITLSGEKVYILCATIVTPYRFILDTGARTFIICWAQSVFALVYVGVDTMFSTTSTTGFLLADLTLAAPVGGTLFDIDTASNILILRCLVPIFSSMGTVKNLSGTFLSRGTVFSGGDSGLLLQDINAIKFAQGRIHSFSDSGTTFITITGATTIVAVAFEDSTFEPKASETVFDIDVTTPITSGYISSSIYSGLGVLFAPGSVDQSYVNWVMSGSVRIPNSISKVFLSMQVNATLTTFAVAGVPVIVEGTWIEESAERFISDSTGRVTYIGLEDIVLNANINIRVTCSTGSNKDYDFSVAKNGASLSSTITGTRVDSSDFKSLSVIGEISLVTNDFLELFVTPEGTIVSITVDKAKYIITD